MLDQVQAKRIFDYDSKIGYLYWADTYRTDRLGERAGWLDRTTGYWGVTVENVHYQCAKIIWLWYHGILPDLVPDHIDQDKTNDRITNLRLATKGQNAMNSKVRCDNTSGFKGVSFCRSTSRWRASLQINGRSLNLGRYNTPEEAHKVWYQAACEAFGEEFVRV